MAERACPSDQELLPLVSGETVPEGVHTHVDSCTHCRQWVRSRQAEVMDLRRVVGLTGITPAGGTRGEAAESVSASTLVDTGFDGDRPSGPRPPAIGDYTVLGLLGEGGQAVVYRGLHPALGQEVAIKLSRRPRQGQLDGDRLVQEGRLLAGLKHPNLARIYTLGLHGGCPFLVMEYIRGRHLKQYAEAEHPSPQQAAALVAKLARAAAAAHRLGIVHQDIKPRNIVIDEAGEPRLIDFGMARLLDAWADDRSADVSGTVAYMAPEQARGETQNLSLRCDIFGLGGVLYFLLTGKDPFGGETLWEALERARRCEVDTAALRNAGVPRALEALCLRALAADPADRPDNADRLAEDLEAFLQKPRKTHRLVWAGAAAAALVLGVGLWWKVQHGAPTGTDAPPPQPVASLEEPRLEIVVWRGDRPRPLADAVPLRSGDQVAISGQVPGVDHAVLAWLDTTGALTLLPAEWTTGDGRRFRYPPGEKTVELEGPAGTEWLLLCGRRTAAIEPEELKRLLADGRAWPALPGDTLLLLDGKGVRWHGSRGPGRLHDRPDSALAARAESLHGELVKQFDVVLGVAFPHRKPSGQE
jgi:tRNA A-37 threonylcarbamoyl transferase component Bud32